MSTRLPSSSPAPHAPEAANKVHYPALNGLRAVAVLLVFAQHYFVASTPPLLAWGWVGVDIFFVLSGFLITGILLDTVDAPHRLRNFYVRRTLRIFPLYYAVLLLVLLLSPLFHWRWSALWLLWPFYLGNYGPLLGAYTSGNYDAVHYLVSSSSGLSLHFIHFWSLCVEEQFYLVWPFIVYSLRRATAVRNLCLAVIVVLPLCRLAASLSLPAWLLESGILHRSTFFRFDSFLIGGLVACLLRGPAKRLVLERASALLTASLTLFLLAWIVACLLLHQPSAASANTPWVETVGFTLIGFAAAGILLLALRPGNLVYRICTLRPLDAVGKVSYGFYLFHEIPIEAYGAWARALTRGHVAHIGPLAAALGLLCTYVLAVLSFRFFETPFLRLKSRFS